MNDISLLSSNSDDAFHDELQKAQKFRLVKITAVVATFYRLLCYKLS